MPGSGGGAGEEDFGGGESSLCGKADRVYRKGARQVRRREADGTALCEQKQTKIELLCHILRF